MIRADTDNRSIVTLLYRIFCLGWTLFAQLACQPVGKQGILHVRAPSAGTYEIYSIAGDATLQFVSEQVGQFNEDLALNPGSYLILADCSHQIVVIHPEETSRLVANVVHFTPPHPPGEGDVFSIQCSRYEKSHLRQHISNRYSFHMVSGVKDLLVGMVPLKLDFQNELGSSEPKTIEYKLAALQVARWSEADFHSSPYFVSPKEGLLSITQAQSFGKWQFLLPGPYQISLNGTRMDVDLSAGEAVTVEPAGIRVSASKEIDLNLFGQIRGNPFSVEINHHHMLRANTTYPVLPGVAKLRLDGSNRSHQVELKGGALTELKAKSVRIDLGCSPWEWECLGKREVNLYEKGEHYPFLDSITDVPILYLGDGMEVGIEGAPGIRYQIPPKDHDAVLRVGKVTFHPKPIYKPGYITDLVRLEALAKPFVGYSYDIVPEHPTTMTLIAGTYVLALYTSFSSPDYERSAETQLIHVRSGRNLEVDVPFYLPQAKVKVLSKALSNREKRAQSRVSKLLLKNRAIKAF